MFIYDKKTDVEQAYKLLLNREAAENEANHWIRNASSQNDLISNIVISAEFEAKHDHRILRNPLRNYLWHFHTVFDAEEIIRRYEKKNVKSSPHHITNFIGVKIRPEFYPNILAEKIGSVEAIPIPSNWHSDIAEWGSCLRAVDLAANTFVMAELGCGWGCWINNLGKVAKDHGRKVKLYGIEADARRLEMARISLPDNGFNSTEYELHQGIIGKKGDVVFYPKTPSGMDFAGVPISQNEGLINQDDYVKVTIIDFEKVIAKESKLDLLHIDIQGSEYDLLSDIFESISRKVRFVFIGTHSRQIEGKLFDLFFASSSWSLEMERACMYNLVDGRLILAVDGIQLWRNNSV